MSGLPPASGPSPRSISRYFLTASWTWPRFLSPYENPHSFRRPNTSHSMRDNAQVWYQDAIIIMITPALSRPKNRIGTPPTGGSSGEWVERAGTSGIGAFQCHCLPTLVHIRVLRLVNRFRRRDGRSRIAARPRRDRQDGHRRRKNHPEDKCAPIWFRHMSPLPRANAEL
jgi:hypothetical protein